MRKNKMMRTASGLLVATLLTTCVISGTFAKYTSSASGSDTARVAKWSFEAGETDIVTNDTFTFDLFNTVNEADTTTEETHLKSANNDTVIAPGTGGSFDIVLTNKSEVTAKYAIDFTETNSANVPIEYSLNKDNGWTTNISSLDISASDDETLTYATGTKTITVYWRWAYEGAAQNPARNQSDTGDTTLGKDGSAKVEVKAEITATQVD